MTREETIEDIMQIIGSQFTGSTESLVRASLELAYTRGEGNGIKTLGDSIPQ